MTVYKYFIKIALKNKGVILSYTLVFLVIAMINGSNAMEKEGLFTETKVDIGIIDNSNSELSKGLKDYLTEKNNIVNTKLDEDYIKEQIFLEIADAVIIIPEDFDERVINREKSIEIYKDDRKVQSMQIQNQINKFITFANATYEDGNFHLEDVNLALKEKARVKLIGSNSQIRSYSADEWFKFYYNFTAYILVALYISVMGLVMKDFTDTNIEHRSRISSKKFLKINMEMYLGQLTVAAIITLIFILGSIILKGKYIGEINFGKYLINTVVFSFSILCLTFLTNNITDNKFIINGMSTVISLGTSFISGVMVPQQFLGENVLRIAKFFPTYYFVRVNEMTVNSFSDIRYEIFMQLLLAIAFLLMGLYFSKLRQKA